MESSRSAYSDLRETRKALSRLRDERRLFVVVATIRSRGKSQAPVCSYPPVEVKCQARVFPL